MKNSPVNYHVNSHNIHVYVRVTLQKYFGLPVAEFAGHLHTYSCYFMQYLLLLLYVPVVELAVVFVLDC